MNWHFNMMQIATNYIPCSITPRIPSSEHIMEGKIRVDEVFDFMQRSYWTSQTSLSDMDWTAVLAAPAPESIIGCCCHLRSQAKTVPKEPPAWVCNNHRNISSSSIQEKAQSIFKPPVWFIQVLQKKINNHSSSTDVKAVVNALVKSS